MCPPNKTVLFITKFRIAMSSLPWNIFAPNKTVLISQIMFNNFKLSKLPPNCEIVNALFFAYSERSNYQIGCQNINKRS